MTLQNYLLKHIPISAHLGVRVVHADFESVRLVAPLGPNLNHRQTAFGGSISAIAILAGWAMLWTRLGEHATHNQIVIQSNSIEYLAPATTDFTAICRAPGARAWEQFMRAYRSRGRGRIELHALVFGGDVELARFSGRYVALHDATAPLAPDGGGVLHSRS